MAKSRGKPSTYTYDVKLKRFRDGRGRFIRFANGMRSATARHQYNRVAKRKRYLPPVKSKVKPKAPQKAKPKAKPKAPSKAKPKPKRKILPKPLPIPIMFELATVPGQVMVTNAESFTINELARLLLLQIEAGNRRFRFWYRLPNISIDYPTGMGSTEPLYTSRLTLHNRLSEIVSFLKGRGGFIKGKVTSYWFSRR